MAYCREGTETGTTVAPAFSNTHTVCCQAARMVASISCTTSSSGIPIRFPLRHTGSQPLASIRSTSASVTADRSAGASSRPTLTLPSSVVEAPPNPLYAPDRGSRWSKPSTTSNTRAASVTERARIPGVSKDEA